MTRPSLMVFAAGFGSRMGALTKDLPKPMLRVGGEPMIDRAVALGREAGVTRIVANVHYLADAMMPRLKDLDVTIAHEHPDILDTGGGLKAARQDLTSPTLTLNPDVFWQGPNPLECLLNAWTAEDEALLLVVPMRRARLRDTPGDFSLKDRQLHREGSFVYTGAQLIKTSVLDEIDAPVFSMNLVWDRLISRGALGGVVYPGTWMDVGSPEGLAAANDVIGSERV